MHKYSVPPSEGCQTPSEGFRLQVKNKHLLLRDSIFNSNSEVLIPYTLSIKRFLMFKEQKSLQ